MKSSIEILNTIRALDEQIEDASSRFNDAEGDAKDALRDAISGWKGEQRALKEQLGDVLAEEDRIRKGGGVPMAATAPKARTVDVGELFLGDRRGFESLEVGARMNLTEQIRDATLTLDVPKRTDYTLPSNVIELPMGIIDVLTHATTDSNLTYMIPKSFTNAADLWSPGETKKGSAEAWDEKNMNLFTVAHWIAVSKQTLHHYGQLQSLISNDLMYGLRCKEDAYALKINDGDGKKGLLVDPDIQVYTAKKGEKFYDSARRMITKAWMASGYRPTHFGVHPLVLEQLDLEKSSDGVYLRLLMDEKVWGVPVVQDVNVTEGDEGSATYGAVALNSFAATWYTSETDALTLGLVNDQLIKNERTLLAEGEHGITVQRPKAIVYLKDAISVGTGA